MLTVRQSWCNSPSHTVAVKLRIYISYGTRRSEYRYAIQFGLGKHFQTRTQSETADLRQCHVVRQVAASYSVWQRFPLCPVESNVNEHFKVIQNPGFLPDHPQNWTTGSFFPFPIFPENFRKILPKLFELSCLHTETNKQQSLITSLVEVIRRRLVLPFLRENSCFFLT